MSETFASTLERLRDVVAHQVESYRRLLDATHAGNDALRSHDVDSFDRILAEQVDTLRTLKNLERARDSVFREVGSGIETDEIRTLDRDLKGLAREVSRAGRVTRFVIERNGELVEARLALHRRAGTVPDNATAGVDHMA